MYQRIHSLLFDLILIALIFFAPSAVGAVHVRTGAILTIGVSLLAFVYMSKRLFMRLDSSRIIKDLFKERELYVLFVFISLFLFFILLQLIPLPTGIVELSSPHLIKLHNSAGSFLDLTAVSRSAESFRTISLYKYATEKELVLYLTYFITFFIIVQEIKEKKRINYIIIALIIAAFLESIYGLYSFFSKDFNILGHRLTYNYAASGTFINRNHYVAFLGIIFPLSAGYVATFLDYRGANQRRTLKSRINEFFNEHFTAERGLFIIMTAVMIPGIIFSLSRMGVFSFIASMGFMGTLTLLKRRKGNQAMLALLLSIGMGISLWYGLAPLEMRYKNTLDSMDDLRLKVWDHSIDYAGDFLAAGSGAGTFEYAYRVYEEEGAEQSRVVMNHAHNDYLELLTETGVPGFLILIGFFIYLFKIMLREWFKRRNAFASGVGLAGPGAMIYMAMHSITDFNFHIPSNGFIFFIVAAISYRGVKIRGFSEYSGESDYTREQEQRPLQIRRLKSVALWAALVSVLLIPLYMILFSINRWRAESIYPVERTTLWETKRGVIPEEGDLAKLKTASSILPDFLDYHLLLGKYYFYGVDLNSLQDSEKTKRVKKGIEQFATALSINPLATEAFTDLARIELARGEIDHGLSLLERSVELSRGDYYSRAGYGIAVAAHYEMIPESERAIYLTRARWELTECMRLNPLMKSNSSVVSALTRIYLLEGDIKGAIHTLDELKGRMDEKGAIDRRLLLARLYLHTGNERYAFLVYEEIRKKGGLNVRKHLISELYYGIKKYPNLIRLRFYLGSILFERGEWDPILKLFSSKEKLSELSAKERADVFFMMGEAYEKRGELREAMQQYKKSLRIMKSHEKSKRKILELTRKGIY